MRPDSKSKTSRSPKNLTIIQEQNTEEMGTLVDIDKEKLPDINLMRSPSKHLKVLTPKDDSKVDIKEESKEDAWDGNLDILD